MRKILLNSLSLRIINRVVYVNKNANKNIVVNTNSFCCSFSNFDKRTFVTFLNHA